MTRLAVQEEKMSVHDFLTLEMNAPEDERWELIGGVLWRMMTGGTLAHNRIVQNLGDAARAGLRAVRSTCWTTTENVKLIDDGNGLVVYPDLTINCGPFRESETTIEDPVVVVEVLSPGTRAKDLRHKGPAYRRLETLRTLVFIEQDRIYVEAHVRTPDGFLIRSFEDLSDEIDFAGLGCSIRLAELYSGLSFAGG